MGFRPKVPDPCSNVKGQEGNLCISQCTWRVLVSATSKHMLQGVNWPIRDRRSRRNVVSTGHESNIVPRSEGIEYLLAQPKALVLSVQ